MMTADQTIVCAPSLVVPMHFSESGEGAAPLPPQAGLKRRRRRSVALIWA